MAYRDTLHVLPHFAALVFLHPLLSMHIAAYLGTFCRSPCRAVHLVRCYRLSVRYLSQYCLSQYSTHAESFPQVLPEVAAKQAEEAKAQEAARQALADQLAAGKQVQLDKSLRDLEDEEQKPNLVIPVPSHRVRVRGVPRTAANRGLQNREILQSTMKSARQIVCRWPVRCTQPRANLLIAAF